MTLADQMAREIEDVAREVGSIRALSRTHPDCFVEDKDAAERKLMKLASRLRTTFGAAPLRGEAGTLPARTGIGVTHRRPVRVEVRRCKAIA